MIVYKEKKIGKGTFADKAKKGLKGLGEAIWFQMGEKEIYLEKESHKRCLVCQWGDFFDLVLKLQTLKKWAVHNWQLKGRVDLFLLGGALILLKFDFVEDVEEVLYKGLRRFANKRLSLRALKETSTRRRCGLHW